MSKYRKIHPDSAQKKLNAFLDKLGSTGNEGLDASKAWTRVSLGQTTISPIDTKAIMDRFKSLQNQEAEMRKSGQLFQLAHCLTEQIFHILDAAETPLGPVLLPLEMALEKICEVEAISRKVFLSTNDVRLKGFLGTTLGLKGLVCSKLNLMEDALKSYSESIDILKPLTKSRDAAIKGSLRDSLINEGNLLARMGRYDAADRCYDEASRLGD
jgi:tetratricopeptide (TPR) repeat protein